MFEPDGKHKLTAHFKTCFPASTLFAVIEGSCYQHQYQGNVALNYLFTSLSVRRTILGEASEPVIQTILNITRSKQLTVTEIIAFYYEAWKQSVSLNITAIATVCAFKYIEFTSSLVEGKKAEIHTRRIEMLQYIITRQREVKTQETEIIVYLEL